MVSKTLNNYSKLMHREQKLYNFASINIPGGVPITALKVVAAPVILTTVLGTLLALLFRINMWNILADDWNQFYNMFFIGSGLAIGLCLWQVQFAGYRLYEYLFAYLTPKRVYTNNPNVKKRDYIQQIFKYDALIIGIL